MVDIWYALYGLMIVLAILVIRKSIREQRLINKWLKRDCADCKHSRNEGCPNSGLCYDTKAKPFFELEDD